MPARTRIPLLLLLLGLAMVSAVPAQGATKIGIADQKPEMFEDKRFLSLKMKFARISVPWDVLRYDFTEEEADEWLQAARKNGVRPLVTFQRSRVKSAKTRPTVDQYRREVKRFRKQYPWIKEYSAWNEPNLEDKRRPKLIASYYKTLRSVCTGCKVLGSDLVDRKGMVTWVRKFLKYTPGKQRPKYWGLHNYVSANRFSTKDTKALQREIRGARLWLTETGGLVARRNTSTVKIRQGKRHAAKVTGFVLRTWGRSRLIDRLYLYHWDSSSNKDTWDSAFVGSDGKARPALGVLKQFLRKKR